MTMRDRLRAGTRDAHDQLDNFMRHTGWQDQASYGAFLQVQYAARLPIERCFSQLKNSGDAPPNQVELIADDLGQLGIALPSTQSMRSFDLPKYAHPIGAYWAMAGSSLGNKAIRKEIERAAAGQPSWPLAFLSDSSMTDYWSGLRSGLHQKLSVDQAKHAVEAATAVFTHFHQTAQSNLSKNVA